MAGRGNSGGAAAGVGAPNGQNITRLTLDGQMVRIGVAASRPAILSQAISGTGSIAVGAPRAGQPTGQLQAGTAVPVLQPCYVNIGSRPDLTAFVTNAFGSSSQAAQQHRGQLATIAGASTTSSVTAWPAILRRKPQVMSAEASAQGSAGVSVRQMPTVVAARRLLPVDVGQSGDGSSVEKVFYRVGGAAAATDGASGVRPEITAVGALPLAPAGTIAVVSQMKPAGGEPWINPQPFPGVTSERKRPRKQQLTELMDATDRPNSSDKRVGGTGSGGSGSALSSGGGRPSVIPIRSAKAKKSSAASRAGSSPPAPAEVEQEEMDVSVAPHDGLAAVEVAPPTVKEANNSGQVNGSQSTGPVRRRRPRLTVNDEARRASASHHNLLPEDAEMVNNLERAAADEIGRRCPVKDSVLQTRKLLTAFYDNSTTEPDLLSVVARLFQLLTEHVRNGAQEFNSVYLSAVMTLMNKLVITSDHGNDMVVMLDAIDRLLDSLVTDYNPYNGPVKMSGPDALDHDGAVNGAANRGRC